MRLKRKRSRSGFDNYCKKIEKTHLKDENNNDEHGNFLNLDILDNSLKKIESSLIQEMVKNDKFCQIDQIYLKKAPIQAEEHTKSDYTMAIQSHVNMIQIVDKICAFIDAFPNFNSIHPRMLSFIR